MNSVQTSIVRWGNSRGIRIPKAVLDLVGLSDDDAVTLTVNDGTIVVQKAIQNQAKPYPSLADLFSGYCDDYVPEEWDTGAPVGKEI